MKLKHYAGIGILVLTSLQGMGQSIDHWETVVYDSMKWRYWLGTADPGATWNTPAFNDGAWPEGRGSVGYGDGDDRTESGVILSVFLRKKFSITNRAQIKDAFLHVDYDDGFIAYLNGVEVARALMPDGTVAFNQASSGLHEALLYQGQAPEGFLLTSAELDGVLLEGENTLAIQVHNENIGSSDLTSAVFFSVGITDASTTYLPTPTWFVEPITFSSNLPLIVINTNGQTIQDETRIVADMGIIDNSVNGEDRNELTDPFNGYEGKISIEIRGESSQMFPKKSYSLETQDADGNNLNVALLGMPAENDWVLYAPYTDKTMMRDVLTFKFGNDLGDYAPRTRYAEVVINGDYKGVYVLIEKIKRDKNRVAIAELQPTDVSGDELTGGYVLRVDKLDGNDYPGWLATPTPQLAGENDITFQYYDPEGGEMAEAQRNYIRNYIRAFQNSLTDVNYTDLKSGYRKYIDIPSTLNYLIVCEIGKNVDAYIFSTYLYKEKDSDGGKLHMGPLWDFNLAFGNVDYWQNSQYAPGWIWNDGQRMFWFRRMVQDQLFMSNLKCRWQEVRSTIMTNDYFLDAIDSIATVLQESQQRNYVRWPILGTYVWPNQYVGQTYADEINFLKQWTLDRLMWMDNSLDGPCEPYTVVTGVEDELYGFGVFPNPFENSVTVQINKANEIKTLQVLDVTGREVFRTTFFGAEFQWQGVTRENIALPKGLYILKLFSAQGMLLGSRKLIKR